MAMIEFMDNEYETVEDLALAFKDHYSEAVDMILYSPKSIIKFIKKNNKKLAKNIEAMLNETEHSDNALAFFIFMILGGDSIFLKGREYHFREFMLAYVAFKDKVDNEYVDFIEDKGLTRTFAVMNPDFKDDAYFIEQNFDTELAKNYLLSYFDKDITQVFHGMLSKIAITGDECFKEASKVCNSEDFYLYIARRYGFTQACKLAGERNSLFDAIKLYSKEISKSTLLKLVTKNFYWWLLDNYNNYDYDVEAKWLIEKFDDVKKRYDEENKLVQAHKKEKADFELIVDLSKELYLLYLTFADYYKAKAIKPKTSVDFKRYNLDKAYCDTLISSSCLATYPAKLDNVELDENGNPIFGDGLVDDEFSIEYKDITRIVYGYKFQLRYITFSFIITLFFLVMGVFFSFGATMIPSKLGLILNNSRKMFENTLAITIFVGGILVATILNFIVYGQTLKTKKALKDYVTLRGIRYKKYVTSVYDEELFRKRFYLADIKKQALASSRILSAFAIGFLTTSVSVLGLALVSIISSLAPEFISFDKVFFNNSLVFIYFLASGLVGFGLGAIKKYKNIWELALIILVVLLLVFGLALIF